ncbi:transient receptor potential cation channel subfamily A member 1-like isoform X2 [Actinia tenebrosa]|uniref:Transient receptor potential cation channel subfamily A member 1-like isoform X1 n=1 Tax=Actinia tenebrosa TaxID=6105 RepID=A0A6P8HDZ7_ACTTE|nr:transient receptor potential cation channel subfamily A member 1-like isoform X1 [Actinia tenebrosa]XP_031550790.1 transient receptor potential cation channel subfamily A member 1-like isoform X2 [Actinia tenebrosa]
MMTNIIKTLVKIIILFIPFVIAFGIPFYLLFNRNFKVEGTSNDAISPRNNTTEAAPESPSNPSGKAFLFDRLPYSLFTTFMLILGEMKYPHTVFKYQPLPHPGISYVIYIIFCVCMPIIIKNLLIGLSVGDVNRILQTAKMEQHSMQVELLLELERATPRKVLRKIWVSYYVEFPNRKKTWKQKLMEFGSPKRTTSNQDSYVNPALLAITEQVNKLTKKVDQQEERFRNILRILNRMDGRLAEMSNNRPQGGGVGNAETVSHEEEDDDPDMAPEVNRETPPFRRGFRRTTTSHRQPDEYKHTTSV